MRLLFLFVLCVNVLLFAACKPQQPTRDAVEWQFVSHTDTFGVARTEVSLLIRGHVQIIANTTGNFTALHPKQYPTEIPNTATTACKGKFAGLTEYFYATTTADTLLEVYEGGVDEGSEEDAPTVRFSKIQSIRVLR